MHSSPPKRRAPAWDCLSAGGLSNLMVAACGRAPIRDVARRFSSRSRRKSVRSQLPTAATFTRPLRYRLMRLCKWPIPISPTIVKKWSSALEGRLRPSRVRFYVLRRSASHSSFVSDLGVLFYRPRMGLRNSAIRVLRLHSPYRDNLPLLRSPGPILVCTYTILLQATGLHPPASPRFLRSRLLHFGFGM